MSIHYAYQLRSSARRLHAVSWHTGTCTVACCWWHYHHVLTKLGPATGQSVNILSRVYPTQTICCNTLDCASPALNCWHWLRWLWGKRTELRDVITGSVHADWFRYLPDAVIGPIWSHGSNLGLPTPHTFHTF